MPNEPKRATDLDAVRPVSASRAWAADEPPPPSARAGKPGWLQRLGQLIQLSPRGPQGQ